MQRITKRTARKLYEEGNPFIMVPHKMRPDSFMACKIGSNDFDQGMEVSFNTLVNSFEYYNCGLAEVGRYAAFYVED